MAWNSGTTLERATKSKSRNDIDTYLSDIELIEKEVNDLLQTLDRNKETAVQTDSVYDPFAVHRCKTSVSIPIESSQTFPSNSVPQSFKNTPTSNTSHRAPNTNKYRKQKSQKIYRSRSNDKVYQDFPSHGRENLAVFEVPSKLKRGRGSWFDDSIDRLIEFQRRLELLNFDDDVRDLSSKTQSRGPYSENLDSSLDYGFETGYCSDETARPESVPDLESRSAGGSTNYMVQRRPINNFWRKELAPLKTDGGNSACSMTKASSLSNSTIDIPMRSSCNRSSTIGSEFSLASSANCSPTESMANRNSTVILTKTPARREKKRQGVLTPISKYRSRSTSSLYYQPQQNANGAFTCKVCKNPLTGRELAEEKFVHEHCLNLLCPICDQAVFCMEEVCVEDQSYHSWCSKCYTCGRSLNNANVNTLTLDNGTLVLSCDHCLRQYVSSKTRREKPIEANLWVSDVNKVDVHIKEGPKKHQKDPILEKIPISDNIWNQYKPPVSALSAESYWKKPASNIVSHNTPPNRRSLGSVYQADSIDPNSSTTPLGSKQNHNQRQSSSHRKVDRKGVCCVCSDDILWDESSDLLSGDRLAHWVCVRNICPVCIKKVLPFDGWSSHGRMYHSLCFKCHFCGSAIAHGKESVKKDLRGYRRLYHSNCVANAGKQAFSKLF